jgi:hypothetical protein
MKKIFYNTLGIYPGEQINILKFILLAFLWSSANSMADTLNISSFLENVGAQSLPIAYLITGTLMIGISSLLIYFLRRTSPYKILLSALCIASIFYFLSSIILSKNPMYIFRFIALIFSGLCDASLIACYWTLVDQYHDLQEAKRIFGLYNAAYFLGYILSGTLINRLLTVIERPYFYLLSSILLVLAIIILKNINKKVPPVEDDNIDELFSGGKKGFVSLIRIFFKSPLAISLVIMSLIIQLLITTTEFNYMNTFAKIFNASNGAKDVLPIFIGKLKALISIGNIITGVFLYRRCIRKIGLGNMILFPALVFTAVFTNWIIFDNLVIAIFGIIAVEGILYTFEDNNFNLLMNAAPAKLKGSVRIINDSFFEPLGKIFSSLVLLICLKSGSIFYGLVLSLIFLCASLILKYLYPKSIFINLRENAIQFGRSIKQWIDKAPKKDKKEIKKDLLKAIFSEEDSNKLPAFKALLSLQDITLFKKLLLAANQFDDLKKISVIELFGKSIFSNDSKVISAIDEWTNSTKFDPLKKIGNFYLAKKGFKHPDKVIDNLDSQDLFSRASAIVTLKKSLANDSLQNAALNRTIALKELELLLMSENEDEISIGLIILGENITSNAAAKAFSFLTYPSIRIKIKAALALSQIVTKSHARYSYEIINQLKKTSNNEFRMYCLEILGKIRDSSTVKDIILASSNFRPNEKRLTEKIIRKMGLKTVPILISIIKDIKLHERCRILASKILAHLALPQLRSIIHEVIELEIQEAYFYFYYGHTIEQKYPLYDMSLLKNALLTSYQSIIEFIIHLLGAAGSIEDCDLIVQTLHSKNEKVKAQAVEALEKYGDVSIFRKIQPLISNLPFEDKVQYFLKNNTHYSQFNIKDLIHKLQTSPSLFDKTVAAQLSIKLKMPDWKQALREQIKTSEEPFHHFAYELLEQ